MNIHKNARLTPSGRGHLVELMESGQTPEAAARAVGVYPRTARKRLKRYRAEGLAGLPDRSSRPRRLPGEQIAREVGVLPAAVSRVLKRLGLNRRSAVEPAEPVRRYERENPGELIHIDIKKLGRIEGRRPSHHRRSQRSKQSAFLTTLQFRTNCLKGTWRHNRTVALARCYYYY
jgi:transposase